MLRTLFVFGIVFYGLYYAVVSGFGALLFYLWVAYFRPQDWVWNAAFLKALNLSFLAGILVLVRAPGSGVRFRFDFRSLLLFSILIHGLISTLLSPYSAYAMPFWIEFAKAVVITYMIASHSVDMARYRKILFVIGLSLGFEGAKQGWVQFLTNPGGKNINEFYLLGDNNGVAVGMLMLVGLFTALAQTSPTKYERWFHQFFAAGVAYRAISTYSRGAFLAAGVLAFLYVLRSKQKVKGAIGIMIVGGAIMAALPAEFWDRMSTITVSLPEEPTDEMSVEEEGANASSASRLHFWAVATRMAAAKPIFGVGLNAFNTAYNEYDFLRGAWGKGRSVHSSWFGILAELGYVGIVLYVSILLLAVSACQRVARQAKKGLVPGELYFYAVAVQMGLIVAIIGGSFVPWQYCEMLWHFIGLSMGLLAVAESSLAKETVPTSAPQMVRPARPRAVAMARRVS